MSREDFIEIGLRELQQYRRECKQLRKRVAILEDHRDELLYAVKTLLKGDISPAYLKNVSITVNAIETSKLIV